MTAKSEGPRQFLGLGAGADPVEVEAQYEELQSFLDLRKVPRSLRPWALRQRVLVDEAYAAAIGEGDVWTEDRIYRCALDGAVAKARPSAVEAPLVETGADWRDGGSRQASASGSELLDDPLQASAAHAEPAPSAHLDSSPLRAATATFEIITEDRRTTQDRDARPLPSPRPSEARDGGRRAAAATKLASAFRAAEPRSRATPAHTPILLSTRHGGLPAPTGLWQRMALGVVLGVAVLGVLLLATRGLPSIGAAAAQTSGTAVTQQKAQVDQKRAAELKSIVEKEPGNKDALFELGEMYITAGNWQDSLDWFTKLLAVDPDNTHARTDVGTDNYNLGRTDEARVAWEDVAKRTPDDPQIHYNLGYLYANPNGKSPDNVAARREWQRVIELAPNTDLAKAAQSGLDALRKQ